MSSAHRSPHSDPNSPSDTASELIVDAETDAKPDAADPAGASSSRLESTPTHAPETDRSQLRAQIADLEATVDAHERRQQAIVDQYERILASRECCDCGCGDEGTRDDRSSATAERRDRTAGATEGVDTRTRVRRVLSGVRP